MLNALDDPPAVVFVTAYDEYALRAFELRAVDYLLKPVSRDRLRETLSVCRPRAAGRPVRAGAAGVPPWLDRLPVEAAGRTVLVDLSEIRFAEARDDLVYVRTRDRTYPTRFSLQELERRLPTPPFLRIHRAFLVNLR